MSPSERRSTRCAGSRWSATALASTLWTVICLAPGVARADGAVAHSQNTWDPSADLLYDDGDVATHGDVAAGDGVFSGFVTFATGGNVEYKVLPTAGDWSVSIGQVGGGNMALSGVAAGATVWFTYDSRDLGAAGWLPAVGTTGNSHLATLTWHAVGSFQTDAGCAADYVPDDAITAMHDDGLNGDAVAGDGTFTFEWVATVGSASWAWLAVSPGPNPGDPWTDSVKLGADGWGIDPTSVTNATIAASAGDTVTLEFDAHHGRIRATVTPPAVCGDGVMDSGEQCDDGNSDNTDACVAGCVAATCGDGYVWSGQEACDDGNSDNTDACVAGCVAATCGDGYVWSGVEGCDDGNTADGDGCSAACLLESCGDGVVDTGEVCDDGNTIDGDGCSATCLSDETCGNGVVDSAVGEGCDDGNSDNMDACVSGCVAAACGDGYVWSGVEGCDDGNTVGGDGCSATCTNEAGVCGDGVVDAGEECDDGNTVGGDGCSATCTNEAGVCGDGVVDAGEECDDGNTVGGDGCSATCTTESGVCGDGVVDPWEECDDGNTAGGDGCSASCRDEDPSSEDSGCSCAASSPGDLPGGLLGLVLVLLGLVRRRRRRSVR